MSFGTLAFGEDAFGARQGGAATVFIDEPVEIVFTATGDLFSNVEFVGEAQISVTATGLLDDFETADTAYIESQMEGLYIDLRVSNDDMLLDVINEPILLADRECIAQDIKHGIRESGLFFKLVGLRDGQLFRSVIQELELLIEEDVRLVPGTVTITRSTTELFYITAETIDFGPINFTVII